MKVQVSQWFIDCRLRFFLFCWLDRESSEEFGRVEINLNLTSTRSLVSLQLYPLERA
jgi:hypothetical protein